jgi:catechol 2,3-dioxygenase
MARKQKVEHTQVSVENLEAAVSFYRDTIGLAEIARENGVVYPGCGYDNNWDLGLSEGEPGFDHVALRLGNTAELDEYEDLLAGNGVDYTRAESEESGVTHEHRFRTSVGKGDRVRFTGGLRVSPRRRNVGRLSVDSSQRR